MSEYLALFQLSSLDGNDGFRINGVATRDYAGWSVASSDMNGDGYADLIIGANKADPNGNLSGASYVVYGGPTLLGQLDGHDGTADGTIELSGLASFAGANGFTLNGVAAADYSGWAVSSAGDVNGDGFDDLIVGTKSAGKSFVVFGGATLMAQLDANDGVADGTIALSGLSDFGGANGFRISGDSNGFSVSSGGDINHDGFDDVIVGSPTASPNGSGSGTAYVVFGKASGFGATLNVSSLDGNNGFKINGEAQFDNSGISVSSAGDVNGDGIDDLLVGSFRHPSATDTGCTYLVFGKMTALASTLELSSLDGVNGYKLQGQVLGAHAGEHVSSAGDVNADGFADIVIGARDANSGAGATYVVFGGTANLAALDVAGGGAADGSIGIHNVNGTTGFRMDGEALYDYSAVSVSSAGDFNGDGFDDLIVGAFHNSVNGPGSGAAYVVFGGTDLPASFGLGTLDGNFGFKIAGEPYSYAGCAVSAAGDVNGDGFDDLIVGAYGGGAHGVNTGASYVIYGAMPGEAVIRFGTTIANTIHGGNFDDALFGLGGKDVLFGHDGHDALNGGGSKDRLTGGTGADVLSGGGGADRFIFRTASESTGSSYDTIKKADFAQDQFDVRGTIGAIEATVASGQLRSGHFDGDLASAVSAAQLGSHHAVLFTPDSGNLAGKTLLIIDVNGVAGYQAGNDLVVNLSNPLNLASLDTGDFI